jgi:predicted alpha/beta hydrolase
VVELTQRRQSSAAQETAGLSRGAGEALTLRAEDGQTLAATWYAAKGTARGAVVIAAATGVPQGFYRRFASWLAERGVAALTFDYRGTARSRPQRLRGFVANFQHWVLDIDAALEHALAHGMPVGYIGHSIGGTLAPLARHAIDAERLVLVGAQTAYWRDWPRRQRWPMVAMWHGLMPAVTLATGYFPGRALRLGEDLPRGVALQWATRPWRNWFDDAESRARYGRALPPVHLVAPRDDAFATDAAQQRVHDGLTGCAVTRHVIEPAACGLERIGHFGLFRENASAAWPHLLSLALPEQALR